MSINNTPAENVPAAVQPLAPPKHPAETAGQAPAPVQAAQHPPTQLNQAQDEEPVPPEEVQDAQADEAIPTQNKRAGAKAARTIPPKEAPPAYRITFPQEYFVSGGFDQDVSHYQENSGNRTGYPPLDNIQPRYPGLYLLGATSSLGKTTFAHQMGDQIAAAGELVLNFALEQSYFELYSKSLARCFFQTQQENNTTYPTPSSIEIRSGATGDKYPDELAEQKDRYIKAVGNRMIVIDGAFSMTVEDIEMVVAQCITTLNRKPVVIIDYLQIVAPSMSSDGRRKMDTREAIDHIVHRLKVLQSQYGLTVIVISSLNRQNYLTPIDFESFKESGGIEYTADVIWGLQLAVMSDELFGREGKIKEKRDKVREAKAASPRAIDLVCIKNRYGQSSYKCQFNYYPASDTFVPA